MREETVKEQLPNQTDRVNILGAGVLCISYNILLEKIQELIKTKTSSSIIITANVDHLYKIKKDILFKNIYDATDIIVADGVPLIWASKLLGRPIPERINGTDLMDRLCGLSEKYGYSVFLLGGHGGTANHCAEVLMQKYPKMKRIKALSPSDYFTFPSIESDSIIESIIEAKPDILFVGLGAPKQEKWLYRYKDVIKVPICIGVGVSFSFISGELSRAPYFFQKFGLEWLWRLFQEPRRLLGRYVMSNSYFIWGILRELFWQRSIKKNCMDN